MKPVNYEKLTPKQRREVRLAYIEAQGGLCYWCGEPLDEPPPEKIAKFKINTRLFPPGFFNAPVHLQHNHVTGMTEGAVHALCNAVMWQYHDR